MEIINVRYSNITSEKLNMYFEKNFHQYDGYELTKENKKWFCFELLANTVRILTILLCTEALFECLLKNVHIERFNVMQNVAVAYMATVLIIVAWWIIYGRCIHNIEECTFQLRKKHRRECGVQYHLECDFGVYFKLQEILRSGIVKEIEKDNDSLIIKYVSQSGIIEKKTYFLGEYSKYILREDCLDFTWIDRVFNEILLENEFPKLEL